MEFNNYLLMVEAEGVHPKEAILYLCHEDATVDRRLAMESFGPFDTLWDVAHWVGRCLVRQARGETV